MSAAGQAALHAHAQARAGALHVWLMTGGFSHAAEERALETGAVALFSKPFEILDFVSGVEKRCAESAVRTSAPDQEIPVK